MNNCTISRRFSHCCIGRVGAQPRRKSLCVPGLHEDRSWTSEFADQPLTRHQVRHDTARRDALEDILAVPSNKMPVVDDVLLVLLQLQKQLAMSPKHHLTQFKQTYIFPDNSAKARAPQDTLPTDLVHEQTFSGEHGLCDALALVLGHDALRARQERVLAHAPRLAPAQLDDGDVADAGGRQQQLARPRVDRLRHFAADQGFLQGELHLAFERDGWGHCYHCAWETVSSDARLRAKCSNSTQCTEYVPGFAVRGHPIANCTVRMVFVLRWLTR